MPVVCAPQQICSRGKTDRFQGPGKLYSLQAYRANDRRRSGDSAPPRVAFVAFCPCRFRFETMRTGLVPGGSRDLLQWNAPSSDSDRRGGAQAVGHIALPRREMLSEKRGRRRNKALNNRPLSLEENALTVSETSCGFRHRFFVRRRGVEELFSIERCRKTLFGLPTGGGGTDFEGGVMWPAIRHSARNQQS